MPGAVPAPMERKVPAASAARDLVLQPPTRPISIRRNLWLHGAAHSPRCRGLAPLDVGPDAAPAPSIPDLPATLAAPCRLPDPDPYQLRPQE
ncbi:MAG: hypothetical protein ACREEU_09535 [Acetobacteraceae bacterium]